MNEKEAEAMYDLENKGYEVGLSWTEEGEEIGFIVIRVPEKDRYALILDQGGERRSLGGFLGKEEAELFLNAIAKRAFTPPLDRSL